MRWASTFRLSGWSGPSSLCQLFSVPHTHSYKRVCWSLFLSRVFLSILSHTRKAHTKAWLLSNPYQSFTLSVWAICPLNPCQSFRPLSFALPVWAICHLNPYYLNPYQSFALPVWAICRQWHGILWQRSGLCVTPASEKKHSEREEWLNKFVAKMDDDRLSTLLGLAQTV